MPESLHGEPQMSGEGDSLTLLRPAIVLAGAHRPSSRLGVSDCAHIFSNIDSSANLSTYRGP
jgi:hypothetical protein